MSDAESYLPTECINAINETNSKTSAMLEVWNDYISNLKNNTNHMQNIHVYKHVKTKNSEDINMHKLLKKIY